MTSASGVFCCLERLVPLAPVPGREHSEPREHGRLPMSPPWPRLPKRTALPMAPVLAWSAMAIAAAAQRYRSKIEVLHSLHRTSTANEYMYKKGLLIEFLLKTWL